MLRFLGNIFWIIFGGLWIALGWFFLGLLLCITIVGIPFGKQCFKAASLTFAPFGKHVDLNFGSHPISNIIWAILAGWEMACGYLMSGIICCITVVGIPFGLQAFKMMSLALFPFGAKIKK